ncbi:hypothetical protein JTE90_026913 [Oedothorax gibbosus]|uniref:Uncharacterized protein n=1 Tax=Oedothorax gibbosus TaxID=931172 RepID=A0AAV6TDR0_9ARAC|nr:hypothetical protein JTE90_026913 [Oedothorax gibbosus]
MPAPGPKKPTKSAPRSGSRVKREAGGDGPARKLHISLGFSRANRGAPGHRKRAVLFKENSVPISGRAHFPGHENLTKEKNNSSPGPPSTFRVRFRFPKLVPPKEPIPCPGWGILKPKFPFPPVGSEGKKRALCLRFGDVSLPGKGFSDPLGRMTPCSTAVPPWKTPFPASVLKALKFSICYTTKICTVAGPGGPTPPGPSTHAKNPDPPTHGRKPPRWKLAVAARYSPTLESHPFKGSAWR